MEDISRWEKVKYLAKHRGGQVTLLTYFIFQPLTIDVAYLEEKKFQKNLKRGWSYRYND